MSSMRGGVASLGVSPYLSSSVAADTYQPLSGNLFVALGDSISTTATYSAAGAGYGAAWPQLMCGLSGQRLSYAGNAGTSGDNSTQILARVSDVIALGPHVVTVLAGANDLSQSVSFDTWSSNVESIAAQLRAAGIRVVLCTIPPRGNTTYLATTLTWNRWLKAWAAANRYEVLDFFALLVDPATGQYASGYDSGDALHPSQSAHVAMAVHAESQIQTGTSSPIRVLTQTDAGNLLTNGTLTTGTPTPTGWAAGGSASADWTNAIAVDSDFVGKAWEVAFTNTAGTGNFRTFQSSPSLTTGYSTGDVLLVTWKHKVTVASGLTPSTTAGLRGRLNLIGSSGSVNLVGGDATAHAVSLNAFQVTVPSGTTSVYVDFVVAPGTVSADYTVRIGEIGLFNLTTLSLTGL